DLEDGAGHFIQRRQFLFQLLGVGDHRAEFIHDKRPSVQTAALLLEKKRAFGSQFDEDADDEHGRKEENQQKEAAHQIDDLFEQAGKWHFRAGMENKHRPSVKIVH